MNTIKASEITVGTRLAESDEFLFDVWRLFGKQPGSITVRLCSHFSSFKTHRTIKPDGTQGGVLKTFRKTTTLLRSEAMNTQNKLSEAYRYLNRIRNPRKRQYGFAYLAFMQNPTLGEPSFEGVSEMAAQAVRTMLQGIMEDDKPSGD